MYIDVGHFDDQCRSDKDIPERKFETTLRCNKRFERMQKDLQDILELVGLSSNFGGPVEIHMQGITFPLNAEPYMYVFGSDKVEHKQRLDPETDVEEEIDEPPNVRRLTFRQSALIFG